MGINNFFKRLKMARKSQQLSQEELAELVGVSAKTVYKWEQGKVSPELRRLSDLATALQVRQAWFFEDESDENGASTLDTLSRKLDDSVAGLEARLDRIETLLEKHLRG